MSISSIPAGWRESRAEFSVRNSVGFWKAIFTEVLADITGAPGLRGRAGELFVNRRLSELPRAQYAVYEDLYMPSSRGETQIDHAVFSRFGIFVIETKNYSGWIFGDENSRVWTRVHFRERNKFQNPFRQNYKHIKALQSATRLPQDVFFNFVVFTGNAQFKSTKPQNVFYPKELKNEILRRRQTLMSLSQIRSAIDAVAKFSIRAKRL